MCVVLWRYVERPARDERDLELVGAGKGQDEDDEDREQLVWKNRRPTVPCCPQRSSQT